MSSGISKVVTLHGRDGRQCWLSVSPNYQWLSDHELLLLRVKDSKGGGGGPDGSFAFGEGFFLTTLDTRSGREAILKDFNERSFGPSRRSIGYWLLSPDRKMLFWPERKKPRPLWHAAALDGSESFSWAQPEGDGVGAETTYYAWTPNSRGWVALSRRVEQRQPVYKDLLDLVIGSLDLPRAVRTIKNFHRGPGEGYPGLSLLGVSPENKAVAAMWGGIDPSVRLFTFPTDTKKPTPRDLTIHLPNGSSALQIVLSPKGDRLGWVLHVGTSKKLDEFWVSRVDGAEMRKVGEVSYKTFFPMEDEHHPEGAAWTPDGRRISFIYKGALRAVEAD